MSAIVRSWFTFPGRVFFFPLKSALQNTLFLLSHLFKVPNVNSSSNKEPQWRGFCSLCYTILPSLCTINSHDSNCLRSCLSVNPVINDTHFSCNINSLASPVFQCMLIIKNSIVSNSSLFQQTEGKTGFSGLIKNDINTLWII